MVQKPKTQSGWGFSVKQGAATNHGDSTDSSLTMAVEAVIHALRWIASRGDSQTTHAYYPHRFSELAAKSEKWNGKSRLACVNGRPDIRKLLWVYCPAHAGIKGNDRADRLAGKATITSGLSLGRSEVLRYLKHYLCAQSQGHHSIDRLEERGVEIGSAGQSSLKGRERAIVSQTNIGNVSEVTLGKLLRKEVERIWDFQSLNTISS